jgi:hypothetical protein
MNGWRSAGDLGLFEDAETEPWEQTAPAPPRSDPKRRVRSQEDRRFSLATLRQHADRASQRFSVRHRRRSAEHSRPDRKKEER